MKVVSIAFVAVLVCVHVTGDPARLLGLPLSMLRDSGPRVLGYGLFALLLLTGGLMIAALHRSRQYGQVCLFGLTAFLLLLVAVSPSQNGLHILGSLVLLGIVYGYYAWLLHAGGSVWLWVHLTIPVLLVLGTQFHSYGLWQKGFILYFLLAVNVHYHLLTRWRPEWDGAGAWRPRRRMVYTVHGERNWKRRYLRSRAPTPPRAGVSRMSRL